MDKYILLLYLQTKIKKMKAIVEIGGKQLKVEKGQTFLVNRLEKESGKKITFDKVFLIEDKGKKQL